jgi:hypothetical protein
MHACMAPTGDWLIRPKISQQEKGKHASQQQHAASPSVCVLHAVGSIDRNGFLWSQAKRALCVRGTGKTKKLGRIIASNSSSSSLPPGAWVLTFLLALPNAHAQCLLPPCVVSAGSISFTWGPAGRAPSIIFCSFLLAHTHNQTPLYAPSQIGFN